MSDPIQINNEDTETIEVSAAEYEAIVGFSTKIAEQNALVLASVKSVGEQMVANAENTAAMFASLVDAIRDIQINISNQAPAPLVIPAPVVNVDAPVTVKPAPDKKKKVSVTVKRDREGRISGADGEIG
jgi:hypothetical protein